MPVSHKTAAAAPPGEVRDARAERVAAKPEQEVGMYGICS